MRILVLSPRFPVASETFVRDQVVELQRLGHEVEVLGFDGRCWAPTATSPDGDVEWELLYRGLSGSRRKRAAALARRPHLAARLTRRSRSGDSVAAGRLIVAAEALERRPPPDVVLAHFGPAGRLAVELRSTDAFRAPVATVFHGYDLSEALHGTDGTGYRRLFAEGDLFLPVTERWADRLRSLGCPPQRTRVAPLGIDVTRLSAVPLAEPGGPLRLLSVARLVEKKGIAVALEAVADAAEQHEISYTIVGDGPLRPTLEAHTHALGLDDVVSFVGEASHAEVFAHLERCEAVLVPSHTSSTGDEEGLPVVIMEAMAAGRAVVATRHSGIPELVRHEDTGLLADPGDPATLRVAVERLAGDTELRRHLGQRGRRVASTERDRRALTEQLATELEALATP